LQTVGDRRDVAKLVAPRCGPGRFEASGGSTSDWVSAPSHPKPVLGGSTVAKKKAAKKPAKKKAAKKKK
jgi:hypothetical protein